MVTRCQIRNSILVLLSVVALLCSCSKPVPEMTGINMQEWKNDKKACGGTRSATVDAFIGQKNKIQGLSEADIVSFLGRPDEQELYKRNQKFYYYWLEPGKACGSENVARKLSIRFNATGAAKEVEVE